MSFSADTLNRYLRCPGCGQSKWTVSARGASCACGRELVLDKGVVSLTGGYRDAATDYYDKMGGPQFVDATFASNPQIHCSTRKYRQYLDGWFPSPAGALLDLGCGDGRLSLWALERGFPTVVALDTSRAALEKLAATAQARGYKGLLPVCATFQDGVLKPQAFDVVLFFEALCYVTETWGLTNGLELLRSVVKPDGRAVISELARHGRLLADVIAVNVENMKKTAYEGKRWEKLADRKVECTHSSPSELVAACERAGFRVRDRGGISPIPMLFQFAWNFTSYPLRPPLDAEMQKLIETLDDQTSELGQLSRNTVVLLEHAR